MSARLPLSVDILISAVRYALGRKTYIVGETVSEVVRVWDELSEAVQGVITRDVRAELEMWQRVPDFAPMQCDIDEWQKLLEHAERSAQ